MDRDRGELNNIQITAIFLNCNEGTDPLMVDVLGLKASQAHGIVNPGVDSLGQNFSEDAHIKQLAEQILKKKRGHKATA